MDKKIYLTNNQVVLNYNKAYPKSREVLLKSNTFRVYLQHFIKTQETLYPELYNYLTQNGKYDSKEAANKFSKCLRMLSIFNMDEIESEYLEDKKSLLTVVREIYKTWRHLQRFAFIKSDSSDDFGINTLVRRDSEMNDLILRTYRLFEERIMDRPNLVYRQIQAGTNACFSIHNRDSIWSEHYSALKDIPIIDHVMLRTPMILHPKSSKRTGTFTETKVDPMTYFEGDSESFFCFPCKVGKLLCFVYFNAKYTASALSMANLFELATKEEANQKPDLVLLFGNPDGKDATEFYYDETENIWLGCISDDPRIEYFGYLKKMCLTLHNLAAMQQGWLPIHGAFVNITLNDGRKKGIMLMGDSGAGKSESIEALKSVGKDVIKDGRALTFKELMKLVKTLPVDVQKSLKGKLNVLNISQVIGYLYSGLVLGLGVPALNAHMTAKSDAKFKAKAAAKKQAELAAAGQNIPAASNSVSMQNFTSLSPLLAAENKAFIEKHM